MTLIPGGYTRNHVITIAIAAILAGEAIIFGKVSDVMPILTLIIGGVFGHAHGRGNG